MSNTRVDVPNNVELNGVTITSDLVTKEVLASLKYEDEANANAHQQSTFTLDAEKGYNTAKQTQCICGNTDSTLTVNDLANSFMPAFCDALGNPSTAFPKRTGGNRNFDALLPNTLLRFAAINAGELVTAKFTCDPGDDYYDFWMCPYYDRNGQLSNDCKLLIPLNVKRAGDEYTTVNVIHKFLDVGPGEFMNYRKLTPREMWDLDHDFQLIDSTVDVTLGVNPIKDLIWCYQGDGQSPAFTIYTKEGRGLGEWAAALSEPSNNHARYLDGYRRTTLRLPLLPITRKLVTDDPVDANIIIAMAMLCAKRHDSDRECCARNIIRDLRTKRNELDSKFDGMWQSVYEEATGEDMYDEFTRMIEALYLFVEGAGVQVDHTRSASRDVDIIKAFFNGYALFSKYSYALSEEQGITNAYKIVVGIMMKAGFVGVPGVNEGKVSPMDAANMCRWLQYYFDRCVDYLYGRDDVSDKWYAFEANHKDGRKDHNVACNLEMTSSSCNRMHGALMTCCKFSAKRTKIMNNDSKRNRIYYVVTKPINANEKVGDIIYDTINPMTMTTNKPDCRSRAAEDAASGKTATAARVTQLDNFWSFSDGFEVSVDHIIAFDALIATTNPIQNKVFRPGDFIRLCDKVSRLVIGMDENLIDNIQVNMDVFDAFIEWHSAPNNPFRVFKKELNAALSQNQSITAGL